MGCAGSKSPAAVSPTNATLLQPVSDSKSVTSQPAALTPAELDFKKKDELEHDRMDVWVQEKGDNELPNGTPMKGKEAWKCGSYCTPTRNAPVFETPESYQSIGTAPANCLLVAAAPLVKVDGWDHCLIRPRGAITDEYLTLIPEDGVPETLAGKGKHEKMSTIYDAIKGGTALIRGKWLSERSKSGQILPRRQELELEAGAIWPQERLLKYIQQLEVELIGVSYCWHTPEHPDPKGEQLRKLQSILDVRLESQIMPVRDLAVFLDWGSLYQKPRNDEQEASFREGLKAVNLWYSHAMTTVILMTEVFDGVVPYGDRGWPTFERAVGGLISDSTRLLDSSVVDVDETIGQLLYKKQNGHKAVIKDWFDLSKQCATTRPAPLAPDAFNEFLKTKVFTNAADHEFVNRKYANTFKEVFVDVEILSFVYLKWSAKDFEALAGALVLCKKLYKIDFTSTPIPAQSLRIILDALATIPNFKELHLHLTDLDFEACEVMAELVPKMPSLTMIYMHGNPTTDAGMAHLAEHMIPKCEKLKGFYTNDCQFGDEGILALEKTVPKHPTLIWFGMGQPSDTYAHMRTHGKDSPVEKMKASWSECGKNANSLWVDY